MNFFHPSQSKSTWFILLKTCLHALWVWLVSLACLPWAICSAEDFFSFHRLSFAFQGPIAVVAFSLFALLNGWSAFAMVTQGRGTPLPLDCPNLLVINGPYAYVRNPMAISGLGLGWSVAVFCGSGFVALYVTGGLLLWNYAVRPLEEKDLLNRFGRDFRHYVDHVNCWIPRRSAYQPLQ